MDMMSPSHKLRYFTKVGNQPVLVITNFHWMDKNISQNIFFSERKSDFECYACGWM